MIDTDMIKALRCLASQDAEGNCYEDIYNFGNRDKQQISCGGNFDGTVPCPYYQNKYEVCFEDGECGEWLNTLADELEKLTEKKGWIPAEKCLPEQDGFYLAVLDGEIAGENKPFVGMAEFENGKWIDDEEDYQCIIAWMPLPDPYRPEE